MGPPYSPNSADLALQHRIKLVLATMIVVA